MPNTIEQAIAYAQAHPKRDGGSWAGWCESFIYRAGGFTTSYSTAFLAGSASGWLNPDYTKAPRGAIHYWDGVGGDGHVAFELGGGLLLMASSRVSNMGTALGTIRFADYGLPLYRGWSLKHGNEQLAPSSSTAGGNATPINTKDTDMARILNLRDTIDGKTDTATIYFDAPGVGMKPIASPSHLVLLQRYIKDAGGDHMFPAERAIVNSYLTASPPTVDAAALTAAVKSAISALNLTATVDTTAIANAVDAVLADNFAAIPKAVNDNAAARMKE